MNMQGLFAIFLHCAPIMFSSCLVLVTGADPDKNMTFSKPIMTNIPRPFPGNAQETDFSVFKLISIKVADKKGGMKGGSCPPIFWEGNGLLFQNKWTKCNVDLS